MGQRKGTDRYLEPKRETLRRKRRRQRRRRRIIRAWTARIIVFGVPMLAVCILIMSISRFGGPSAQAEETVFTGASPITALENTKSVPTIVIDAGHGGRDQGTSAGDILEKDVNLKVAQQIAKTLKKSGVNVILTRDSDTYMGLEERAELANQAGADLFVSIHCNYCEEDTSVQGMECYYTEDSTAGQELAEQILSQVSTLDNVINRGARSADYRVLLRTKMPAALVELGFFSNRAERGRLTDPDYQQMLAEEIAAGILNYQNSAAI